MKDSNLHCCLPERLSRISSLDCPGRSGLADGYRVKAEHSNGLSQAAALVPHFRQLGIQASSFPSKSSQDHRKSDVLWKEHQPRKRRFSPNLASIPTHLSGPTIHPSKPSSGITSSVYLILPQAKLVPPQSLLHFAHNCHNSYHIVCN